jgi:pimeloyl-ACP methyl ester carboxylesterase/predicted glycosyltransferase
MRAAEPREQATVDVDGVAIAYEVYGEGTTTIVFTPVDLIVHSRMWKGQVPYLARYFRVVTIDPRGNGRSDRPTDPSAYGELQAVADTIAVMDAVGVPRAVLVGICSSAGQALLCAGRHPDRVLGVVAFSPGIRDTTPPLAHRVEALARFEEERDTDEGYAKFNQHYWLRDWPGFAEFFFDDVCSDPHSTKVIEDLVGYALEGGPQTQIAESRAEPYPATGEENERLLAEVSCPVLVVHGTADRCQPYERGANAARLTGGDLVTVEGGGHVIPGRFPVLANLVLKDFVDRVTSAEPAPPPRTWRRSVDRRPKVLYLSSPIGLGHARRDLAIARALRKERPDVEISWLTQSPVSEFLESAGESVHPASRWLANESAHIESEAGEHDLHAFQAIRRMDEVLVNNFMVFHDLVTEEPFDLLVGDESWDVDHFLHEHPELKRAPFAWMTDFVGWVPMADGGDREERLTSDYNAEMVEHVARYPRLRDRSIFVGEREDVVDLPLGPGLPGIRSWTEEHFEFAGYVMGDRPDQEQRESLRRRLGYRPDETVCLVSVGGSGVGGHLLRKVVAAFPEAARRIPGLRMVVVAGPRIDPSEFGSRPDLDVRGFVPDLDLHHAACDIAVVQGGLTTTMELTASGRPFLYFPLGHHFEQQVHVRHRLERYGAGRCMDYWDADPDAIADALVAELARQPAYLPVNRDGADRAAQLLTELF